MAKSQGRFLAELLGSDGKVEKAKSDAGIYAGANVTIAADGTLTTTTLPLAGGALTGAVTTTSTIDGRDVSVDGTKLDGVEALADVTDATNVTAAGALMDSELTAIASVKALNQGVASGDSPTFGGLTVDTMTLNASSITGTSNLTFDVAGDINLDAGGGDVIFKHGGALRGSLKGGTSAQFELKSLENNADFVIKGIDNNAEITALTLDMSNAGAATFSSSVTSTTGFITGANTRVQASSGMLFLSGPSALVFEVGAGSEKVRLTSTGLGIDIQVPTQKLEILNGNTTLSTDTAGGAGSNSLNFRHTQNTTAAAQITATYTADYRANLDFLINKVQTNSSPTLAMRIDKSGHVGIGTDTPVGILSIYRGAGVNAYIEVAGNNNTPGTSSMLFGQNGSSYGYCWNRANQHLLFGTNNIERMRMTSDGIVKFAATTNYGNGSTFPSYSGIGGYIHGYVNGSGTTYPRYLDIVCAGEADGSKGGNIRFLTSPNGSTTATEKMRVDQAGSVLVGTTSAYTGGKLSLNGGIVQPSGNQKVIGVWGTSGLQMIGATGGDNVIGTMGANEPLLLRTGSSERARIDASGNLMVGAGSTSTRTVLTPDAVFQSYYGTESAARIHLGRDVGIGGGAGVAFGGGGGYALIGTDNTSGTNLYFNAGSNAVGSLTTGPQMVINGSTSNIEMRGAANVRLDIGSQGTPNNNSGNWMYANGTKLRFNNAGGGYLFESLGGSGVTITAAGDVNAAGDVRSVGGATKIGGTSTVFSSSSFGITTTAQTVVPRSAITSLPTGVYLMRIYMIAGGWYSSTVTGIVQHYNGTTNSNSTSNNTIHLTGSGHALNAGILQARYQTFLGNSNNHGVQIWSSGASTTPITIYWTRLA